MTSSPLQKRSIDPLNRSKASLPQRSSFVTNSTCVSRPSSTIGIKHKTSSSGSNYDHVVELLNATYKGFTSTSYKERPDEPLGAFVARSLEFENLLDFIAVSDDPAILCEPSASTASPMPMSTAASSSTYLPSNATSTTTLSPLYQSSATPAASYISHNQLHSFISTSFNLSQFNLHRGSRVAVCLPQGPSLGLCLISVMSYCVCAPVNDSLTPEEQLQDYRNMRIQAVIIPYSKLQPSREGTEDILVTTLRQAGLQLIGLEPENDNEIAFTLHHDPLPCTFSNTNKTNDNNGAIEDTLLLNQPDDNAMILQTSGTSGTKKVVLYTLRSICVGTTCVSASYGTRPTDVNINMMPLFHVGGVVRGLLTPLFSAGSVILCKGFDAGVFWDILEKQDRQVWYFAVPTMHQAILQEGSTRRFSEDYGRCVKMVCNAGGDLVPVLAKRLGSAFSQAVVLPSYGMTECLPITAPPRDYDLGRPGSCGIPTGPDLMIAKDGLNVHQDSVTGHIMIRGAPCFNGYEGVDRSTVFDSNGWFDTGDLGYLQDGYLYVTGRSKEIINRGGEVISPSEVEDVLLTHPKVEKALVFSTPHETLQETIGAVIVIKEGQTRLDLRSLRAFMEKQIHQSKLPQVLVYMDDIPKNAANKPLRIQFSQRLDIPMFMESENNLNTHQRLYEAICPPKGTPLTVPIARQYVTWSMDDTLHTLKQHPEVNDCALFHHPSNHQIYIFVVSERHPSSALTDAEKATDDQISSNRNKEMEMTLLRWLETQIHDYMIPKHMILVDKLDRNAEGMFNDGYLYDLVQQQQETSDDPVALTLRDIFAYVLGMAPNPSNSTEYVSGGNDDKASLKSATSTVGNTIHPTLAPSVFPIDGDFFEYGGSSLKSGFLISQIRARLQVVLPVTILYEGNNKTPLGLADTCRERMPKDHPLLTMGYDAYKTSNDANNDNMMSMNSPQQQEFGSSAYKERMARRESSGAHNPFHPFTMFTQLSPIFIMQPMQTGLRWFFFAYILSCFAAASQDAAKNHWVRLAQLLASLVATAIASAVIFPLVSVFTKWLVIGRYRAGKYPLWGQYYLRWWFVRKVIEITGLGVFAFSERWHAWYLWMMGAKIGKQCRVHVDADIQEFDLITIGDGCTLDKCTVRAFTLSTGHMNLNPVVIGDDCIVGLRSYVLAGTILASDTVLGPLTSNHHRNMDAGDGASASMHTAEGIALADLSHACFKGPHFLFRIFVGWPLVAAITFISNIPWMCIIYLLTNEVFFFGSANSYASRFSQMILYFAMPKRVGYHFLAVAVRKTIVPILHLFLVILMKRYVIGEFKAGPRRHDQLTLMKYWMLSKLLPPESNLNGVASIIGTHYETISIIYRLLGAKIGKRVYWPGSGLRILEYDLLRVGDDVIFGSRCDVLCSDNKEAAPISVGDGAMLADNCILLPGSSIGREAVLGSGGLLKKGFKIADGSTWFGSFNGNAIKFKDGDVGSKEKSSKFDDGEEKKHHHSNKKKKILGASVIDISNHQEDHNDDEETRYPTLRPFGRAFYLRKANYFVVPLFFVVPFNILVKFIGAMVWAVPVTAAIQVAAYYQGAQSYQLPVTTLDAVHKSRTIFDSKEGFTLLVILGSLVGVVTVMSFLALSADVAWKWILFGRRKQGQYNWDESSYCQRWQFLISVQQTLRQKALDYLGGSAWILIYFRALGCRIGQRVCLYPAGGDPMMTEPDLVTLEDDVAVDRAALICHLNTLGQFSINPLYVGAGSVLRAGSRLASGAAMLEDCTLLENSLIISGEVAQRHSVWQGYPAAEVEAVI